MRAAEPDLFSAFGRARRRPGERNVGTIDGDRLPSRDDIDQRVGCRNGLHARHLHRLRGPNCTVLAMTVISPASDSATVDRPSLMAPPDQLTLVADRLHEILVSGGG